MLYKNTVEKRTLELLIKLQSNPEFSNFYLAGGTALALQIGHRKSIDLDFFSLHDFDNNYLLEFLEHDFEFYLDYSDKNTLKGSINDIKIDILSHKYPLVKQVVKYDRIILYSVEDIIAMKLNAIAGNGTRSKDFIDIYFTLNNYSIKEMLRFYKIKYKTRNILHIIKSLNYFDDVNWQDWPELILEKKLKIEDVKDRIEKQTNSFLKTL